MFTFSRLIKRGKLIMLNQQNIDIKYSLVLIVEFHKSMDFFKVFEYELASTSDEENISFEPLKKVKVTKINIHLMDTLSFDNPQNVREFENLHVEVTQDKVLFTKMIQKIVKSIDEMMVNFVNVTLLCQDIRFFTEILPRECERRGLAVPYVFMNFLDIKEVIRNSYECPYKRLEEIVEFLKICSLKEAQSKSQTELLERILKRLHKDNILQSTSERFIKKCKKVIEQAERAQEIKSKYYKIIGLPFKSFPGEIMQILTPQVSQDRKEICFIYEKQRFSGRAIIKIPQDYEQYLLPKNRMYIGQRYIELEISTEEEFEKAKIKLENRSNESPNDRNERRQDSRQNQREFHNIGPGSRRQRSRSPVQYRRSRDRHESSRAQRHEDHFHRQDYQGGPGEYGVKIRGLPFSFSQWDVENIFNPYNMIGGSVKLGIKPGTTLKNGEAVILMRNYNDAQKCLGMNGFRCLGRYLEVRVIGKEDYLRYK